IILLVARLLVTTHDARPTVPPSILNHSAILQRQHLDNRDFDWYQQHIPFFESPDSDIDATYYYRWQLVTKHLTYASPATGYVFTEFIDRPFWSGAFGAISCPLGHQMYEIRWLKDHPAVEDYARYWFETPGAQPRSYSNWYGDAVWATYLVTANRSYLHTMLPHMKAQYAGWMAEHWDATHRMFRWDGLHDGMEVNINSRLTTDPGSGAEGYRPTLNSYLFADARAIANAAALFGDTATARDYAARAADLKRRVQQELWDSSRTFFFHQFAHDEKDGIRASTLTYRSGPFAGNPHGREEIGYVPWQFNLPDTGFESAWRFLMDTAYFFSAHGPTTVERHDPQFEISPHCCVWSGNEWPYATTQTLVALANLLNTYHQSFITRADYARLLRTYTLDQRMNGRPYIAEAANPDNGSWNGHNTFDHSEHYFHSGYVDLVIAGIAGIRPRADDTLEVNPLAPSEWNYFALEAVRYHGHDIAIVWDRDGSRYHLGAGLTIQVDGVTRRQADRIGRMLVYLGQTPDIRPIPHPMNFAVNNGHHPYPLVRASYSAPGTSPHYLNDGNYWYDASPPDRWTTTGSPHSRDTVTIEFGASARLDRLALYLLDDSTGVHPPKRYEVEAEVGAAWTPVPAQHRSPADPTGRMANVVAFTPFTARAVRIVLTPQAGAATGLSEIETWGPATPVIASRRDSQPTDLAWGARASASFTSKYDSVSEINDMVVAFSRYSRNRWTAFGSPNASDWVELDFPAPRQVRSIELYLWGDGGGVKAPKSYHVQTWAGAVWKDANILSQVPEHPLVSSVNTVRIEPVMTTRLRVVFDHDLPAAAGLAEIRIFGSD
ncbi:MAG: MGH1-like glycoside hydrolase domain-containing protein, partial [Gemmatimonadales bacterium]